MENSSIKKNPITTIVGIVATLAGLGLYFVPFFRPVAPELIKMWYLPLIPTTVGLVLWFGMGDQVLQKALGIAEKRLGGDKPKE